MTTIQPVAVCCRSDHARHLARRYALVELFLLRVLDVAPDDAPAEERDLRGERIPRQEGWP